MKNKKVKDERIIQVQNKILGEAYSVMVFLLFISVLVKAYELGKLKLLDTSIDSLSTAFQVLRSESLKSEEGQYFTPIPVIRSCVELMDVDYDDKANTLR